MNWITTDDGGYILALSEGAAELLNMSPRGALGRSLPLLFTEDRPTLITLVLQSAAGRSIVQLNTLRPRDRRAVRVRLDVSWSPPDQGDRVRLNWILSSRAR
jgi:hypothetical protein